MTELKTLEDLELHNCSLKEICECEATPSKILKAEAMKWVKHEEKGWTQNINNKEYNCSFVLINWIKMFFNLTEEDLK